MTDGEQLSTDGQFGAVTDHAVRSFQQQSGLAVDGIAGRQTLSELGIWKEPATPPPTMAIAGATACDPSYPDVCIPVQGADLDCDDIPFSNFRVLSPDPHNFDSPRDADLIGCEK